MNIDKIDIKDIEFGEPIEKKEPSYRDGYIRGIYRVRNIIDSKQKEIERLIISLQAQEELTMNEHIKVERLNNIINELEHHLYQEWLEWKDSDCESIYSRAGEDKAIYDYLQELKGSDK